MIYIHRLYPQEIGFSSNGEPGQRGGYLYLPANAFDNNFFPKVNNGEQLELKFNIIDIFTNTDTISNLKLTAPASKTEVRLNLGKSILKGLVPYDFAIIRKITGGGYQLAFVPYKKALSLYKEISILFLRSSKDLSNHQFIENDGPFNHLFNIQHFHILKNIEEICQRFSINLFERFTAALITKPFVILTGLSGSGKTQLARMFATWISADESQYKIVPVGADWTNREPLLGYPNALVPGEYVKPENGVVDLLIAAKENPDKPYFLILDEMNLSHVERYFADFLSTMESHGKISLHSMEAGISNNKEGDQERVTEIRDPESGSVFSHNGVPSEITLPPNLFIIGTVNVDETTYMFSPKVLDRANVIEFRLNESDISEFLDDPHKPEIDKLAGIGSPMGEDFVAMAKDPEFGKADSDPFVKESLKKFFKELKTVGAEFGYRTAYEVNRFAAVMKKLNADAGNNGDAENADKQEFSKEIMDAAIIQKLLPKLHGSQRKLKPVLIKLAALCLEEDNIVTAKEETENSFDNKVKKTVEQRAEEILREPLFKHKPGDSGIRFYASLEKIHRMYRCVDENGFASFAEA